MFSGEHSGLVEHRHPNEEVHGSNSTVVSLNIPYPTETLGGWVPVSLLKNLKIFPIFVSQNIPKYLFRASPINHMPLNHDKSIPFLFNYFAKIPLYQNILAKPPLLVKPRKLCFHHNTTEMLLIWTLNHNTNTNCLFRV